MKKTTKKNHPWCPFCGQKVAQASDAVQRKMNEFPVGRCQCGAVYSCDATGHNIGAAMVETLVFACEDNWDLAWELMPEDDYLTGRIENYDEMTHQVVEKGNIDGRPVRGVLYFVRLHTEMSELARRLGEKKKEQVEEARQQRRKANVTAPPDPKRKRLRADKKTVREMAEEKDMDGLTALCLDDRKTLRLLQRRLYDPLEENRWVTAWLLGKVCGRVSDLDPGQVSELLHRMFEACSDSAAANWGMVEAIGAIISERPDIFGAFTRYLFNYLGDGSTVAQSLWALGSVAEGRPDLIRDTPFFTLFHFLAHERADVRGLTARLLGNITAEEAMMQLMGLAGDEEEFTIWEDGEGVVSTVAREAAKAVKRIHGEKNNGKTAAEN